MTAPLPPTRARSSRQRYEQFVEDYRRRRLDEVSEADARLLASADPRAKLVIVDGMNHVLKLVPSDMAQQLKSYSDPSLPVAPELVSAIASFVKGVRPR